MPRTKILTPVLLVMFALGGMCASAASAASPQWWVLGKALASGATEPIAESTHVTKSFVVKLASGFGVECTSVRFEEAYIEGEKTRRDKSIIVEGCKAIGMPLCTIGTIKTKPMISTVEGTSPNFKLNFKPATGTEVATVSTCIGNITIDGTMACNYPGVTSEKENHILEFTATSGSELTQNKEPATLTGIDEFWLTSGKKWSVQ